jgi:hypothetical protein
MAYRIEKDAKRLTGLEVSLPRAHGQRMGLIFVEIVAVKVKMQLLRHGTLGPGGRDEMGNLLKAQHPSAVI